MFEDDDLKTVLLVDDDKQVRTLIYRYLEKAGYLVLAASNGEDALLVCRQYRRGIDLLITDIEMTGISGSRWRN